MIHVDIGNGEKRHYALTPHDFFKIAAGGELPYPLSQIRTIAIDNRLENSIGE